MRIGDSEFVSGLFHTNRCLSPPKPQEAVSVPIDVSYPQRTQHGCGSQRGAVLRTSTCHTLTPCSSQPGSGMGMARSSRVPEAGTGCLSARSGGAALRAQPGTAQPCPGAALRRARQAALPCPAPPCSSRRSHPHGHTEGSARLSFDTPPAGPR